MTVSIQFEHSGVPISGQYAIIEMVVQVMIFFTPMSRSQFASASPYGFCAAFVFFMVVSGCGRDTTRNFQIKVSFSEDIGEETAAGLSIGDLESVLCRSASQRGQISGFANNEKGRQESTISKSFFSRRIPNYLLIAVLEDGYFSHWEIYDFRKAIVDDVWNSPVFSSTDQSIQFELMDSSGSERMLKASEFEAKTKIRIKESSDFK